MANLITSIDLIKSQPKSIFIFSNQCDGTAETDATKVDISTLPGTPTKVKINRIAYTIEGLAVSILFDHSANDRVITLVGSGVLDLEMKGGIPDPASSGGTGDILFTIGEIAAAATRGYTILLEIEAID